MSDDKKYRRRIMTASIVPGLGFWLLGKRKYALTIAGLFLATLVLAIAFDAVTSSMVFIVYVLQFLYLRYELNMRAAMQNFAPAKTQNAIMLDEEDLKDQSRAVRRTNKILYPQLEPDDKLVASLIGQKMKMKFMERQSLEQFAIGVTDTTLIIVGLDIMGKAAYVNRVPLEDIANVEVSRRLLLINVKLTMQDESQIGWRFSRIVSAEVDKLIAKCRRVVLID